MKWLILSIVIIVVPWLWSKIINALDARKRCDHKFELEEVMNLNIDPKCVYCNRKISKLT